MGMGGGGGGGGGGGSVRVCAFQTNSSLVDMLQKGEALSYSISGHWASVVT